MTILVGEPENNIYPWKTSDGKFDGYLIPPVTLTPKDGSQPIHLHAGALLAVPKRSPNEVRSINKYSPLIAQAPTIEDLKPAIEAWVKKNEGKTLWELRTR
jgi:hypothetical protein